MKGADASSERADGGDGGGGGDGGWMDFIDAMVLLCVVFASRVSGCEAGCGGMITTTGGCVLGELAWSGCLIAANSRTYTRVTPFRRRSLEQLYIKSDSVCVCVCLCIYSCTWFFEIQTTDECARKCRLRCSCASLRSAWGKN